MKRGLIKNESGCADTNKWSHGLTADAVEIALAMQLLLIWRHSISFLV